MWPPLLIVITAEIACGDGGTWGLSTLENIGLRGPFPKFQKRSKCLLCTVKSISNICNPPYEELFQGHFHKMIIWENINIQCICIFTKNMNIRSVETIQQTRCLLSHSWPGFQTPTKTPVFPPIWIPELRASRKSWAHWGLTPQNLKQEVPKNESSSAFPLSKNSQ